MITARQKRALKVLGGSVLGGGLGFAYYAFVGCSTGACPITSDPVITTIWGGIIGTLAVSGTKE